VGLLSGIVSAAEAVFSWFTGSKTSGTSTTPSSTGTGTGSTNAATSSGGGILGTIDNLLTSGTTAASDAAGMFGSAAAFMEALTDGRMWRSLGWLVAGLVLIIMGFVLWVKGDLAPPVRPRQPGPY